jgi:hypothetical protein
MTIALLLDLALEPRRGLDETPELLFEVVVADRIERRGDVAMGTLGWRSGAHGNGGHAILSE